MRLDHECFSDSGADGSSEKHVVDVRDLRGEVLANGCDVATDELVTLRRRQLLELPRLQPA
jgi:hypothetical protein